MKYVRLIAALIILIALVLPAPVWSYVDPGTGSAVFGVVAYILAGLGVVAAFCVGLLKKFWGTIFGSRKSESKEQE